MHLAALFTFTDKTYRAHGLDMTWNDRATAHNQSVYTEATRPGEERLRQIMTDDFLLINGSSRIYRLEYLGYLAPDLIPARRKCNVLQLEVRSGDGNQA